MMRLRTVHALLLIVRTTAMINVHFPVLKTLRHLIFAVVIVAVNEGARVFKPRRRCAARSWSWWYIHFCLR